MDDISDLMLEFKEAIRHSWNTYFAPSRSPMSADIQEAFNNVEIGLFQAIVLSPLGIFERAREYRKHPLSFIIVKPVSELREVPMQIGSRDAKNNIKWGMPISIDAQSDMTLEFYDFFDWYSYGHIDLPYVRVRVRDLPGQNKLQGNIALIEQHVCRFFFSKN